MYRAVRNLSLSAADASKRDTNDEWKPEPNRVNGSHHLSSIPYRIDNALSLEETDNQ
jgi:hypothetical protein